MNTQKFSLFIQHFLLSTMALASIVLMLYVALVPVSMNRDFYRQQFIENGSAARANVSKETLEEVIDHVLKYLWDEEDSMQLQITTLDHQTIDAFSQRELDHMVDVKLLFINGRTIAFALLLYCLFGAILLWTQRKKKQINWIKTPLITYSSFLGLLAIISGLAAIDFNRVFTIFHHIFFTNDLWLLEYDDLLIIMLPESLFATIVFKTLIRFFLQIIIVMVSLSFAYSRIKKNHFSSSQ